MDSDKSYVGELVGKLLWVSTRGGAGSKDASVGNYKATLIGFDGKFIKLEYEMKNFAAGASVLGKGVVMINIDYVISLEEYRESLNV
jgi:hypothetical protein